MRITADPRKAVQAVLADPTAAADAAKFANLCRKEIESILGSTSDMIDCMICVAALWYAGRMEEKRLIVLEASD